MSQKKYFNIIKQAQILSKLSNADLGLISPFLQEINLPSGKKFILQSNPISGAYFIVSGEVLLYTKYAGETYIRLHHSMPKDCIGLCGLDRECLSFYTAMTKKPSTLLKLPLELIELIAKTNPALCHKIYQVLAKEFLGHQNANIQDIHHALDTNLLKGIPAAIISGSFQLSLLPIKNSLFSLKPSIKTTKIEKHSSLLKSSICQIFDTPQVNTLFNLGTLIEISPHTNLYHQAQNKNCWFIILEGCIEIFLDFDGKISKLGLLGPKSVFGEISEFELHHRREIYRTREPSILLRLNPIVLDQLLEEDPVLYYQLYRLLTHQIMSLVSQTRRVFEPILHFRRHPEKETL